MSEQATGTPRCIASSIGRPKPSPRVGNAKHDGRAPEGLEVAVVDVARDVQAVGDAELARALVEPLGPELRPPGEDERDVVRQQRQRLDEQRLVLVRPDRADAEHDAPVAEPETLAHGLRRRRGRCPAGAPRRGGRR